MAAIDRRVLLPVLLGLAAMAAAIVDVFVPSPVLAILAGLAALAGASYSLSLVSRLDQARAQARRLEAAVAEHDPAMHTGAAATLVDIETGLPDEWFFELVLEGRIAAARRQLHPLTLVLVDIELASDADAGTLAAFVVLLRRTLRDADIACRTGPRTFGLILERTPEEGGVWAAERIQLALVREALPIMRAAAAVATYPTHGLAVDEVVRRARLALARAVNTTAAHGLGQVEVARSER